MILPGPKSPHSDSPLEKTGGPELSAWAAAELDGFGGVSKKPDGSFDGNKGGRKPVPDYASDWREVDRMAKANLSGKERLTLHHNGNPVALPEADATELESTMRALILASMHKRGAV